MLDKANDYLCDPRFHRERKFLAIVLPAVFVVLPVLFGVMFFAEIRESLESGKAHAPAGTAVAAPGPLVLAEREIRSGNLAQAEEILREAIRKGEEPAAAHRKLGLLLERQGDYAGAVAALGAAISLGPEASDFFHRGQCSSALGHLDEAGEDFSQAVRLAPSSPLFSNRYFLYLLGTGDAGTVRNRMKLDIQLELANTRDGWIVAAAAVALQEGKVEQAAGLLSEAAARFSEADLAGLLKDPVFDPHRQIPSLSRFLLRPAATPPPTRPSP